MNQPSQEDVDSFCLSARYGRIDDVRKYLDMYGAAIIDKKDGIGDTALIWVAWAGRMDIVILLLDHGADMDVKGTGGKTAMGYAIMTGHADVVTLLLARGARVDQKDDQGQTVLMVAMNSYPVIAKAIEQEIEKRKQRLAGEERQKKAAADKIARETIAARREKLKNSRPAKPPLKKNPPPKP